MRTLPTAAMAVFLVLQAGCQHDGEGAKAGGESVSVPVNREAILDDTYVTGDTATIRNEDAGQESFGVVTLSARRARGESEETGVLSVSVQTSAGESITCRMQRSVKWSEGNGAIDLQLRCGRHLNLGRVTAVTLPN